MLGFSRSSLAVIALLLPKYSEAQIPPHQQPGAVEECLKYITSSFDGGLEYCQNSCRWSAEVSLLNSRCQQAGKINLLDCIAYSEVACEQSRPGQIGVGGGSDESASTSDEVALCKRELGLVSGVNLPATYCADRCSYYYQNSAFQKGCDASNYDTLVDCVDYVEAFCEKNGKGTGDLPSNPTSTTTKASNNSGQGLKDIKGCKSTIKGADGSRKMNSWCQSRCEFLADNADFIDGCEFYGKSTLAECVDWVEDLCVVSSGSRRSVAMPSNADSLKALSDTPIASSEDPSVCQRNIKGVDTVDDEYCRNACVTYAQGLKPLCVTSLRGSLVACVDFYEPRCVLNVDLKSPRA